MLRIGGLEHHVASLRVVVPAIERLDIHRAQLPLAEWIFNAGREALLLFLHADFQPDLDHDCTGCDRKSRSLLRPVGVAYSAENISGSFHGRKAQAERLPGTLADSLVQSVP